MTDLEHNEFMTKGGGRNLIWNNYYTKLDADREYRGQWTKDRLTWTGIG